MRIFKVDEDKTHISLRWGVSANEALSKSEGRPVYDKVLIAKVLAPHSSKSEFECVIRRIYPDGTAKNYEPHASKYRAQVDQFEKSDAGGDLAGTPIDAWAPIDAAVAASLKALNIHTVEILAEQEGTGVQRLGMGGVGLVQKARNWLEQAKGGAAVSRLTAEMEKATAENADLKRQLAELAERMDAAEKRRGPGRPPNSERAA